jgi:inhibitor of KinA
MTIDPLGDSALLVRLPGDSAPGTETTDAVLAAVDRLRAANISGVLELAPAYNTVGVFYDGARVTFDALAEAISSVLQRNVTRGRIRRERRVVEVPVCYDEEFAPDLSVVAKASGLGLDKVVQLHASAEYRVGFIGFAPGFPYLVGLPPQLATPRRAVPRQMVPAGAVAIGGGQTGIYPSASPGGWNVIGRTPLRLFETTRAEPALLRAGDGVRFHTINRAEFDALSS